jgi:uncharacterized repeat protein (TIGR01451 family)
MTRAKKTDWRPLLFALVSTLLLLALTLGPHAEANDRLLQTVPTPTPRTVPTVSDTTPSPPDEEPLADRGLALAQQVSPPDVLPGEEIQFTLWLTNTSSGAIQELVLVDPLDPLLLPLEVRATQGGVELQGATLVLHLGTLEAGQTALIVVRARIAAGAQPGQILLNQFTATYEGGELRSNIAAAGLPPDRLPATGQDGRGP